LPCQCKVAAASSDLGSVAHTARALQSAQHMTLLHCILLDQKSMSAMQCAQIQAKNGWFGGWSKSSDGRDVPHRDELLLDGVGIGVM
jgi:hypothetical protein